MNLLHTNHRSRIEGREGELNHGTTDGGRERERGREGTGGIIDHIATIFNPFPLQVENTLVITIITNGCIIKGRRGGIRLRNNNDYSRNDHIERRRRGKTLIGTLMMSGDEPKPKDYCTHSFLH